jgi:carbonic anhydrase
MTRYFSLLIGALALTCALAAEIDEEDESPNVALPATTTTQKPHHHHHHHHFELQDSDLSLARAPQWTFAKGPFGPSQWGVKYPKCNQLLQAPLNINTSRVIPARLHALKYKNFAKNHTITVANIFRYGVLDFTHAHPRISVSGGPLPGKTHYYLVGAYLMVGKNATNGSAHAINGKKAPFEISFVFHPNPNTTLESIHHGPVFIVHFLGKISKHDNPNYASVVSALKKVTKAGTQHKCAIASVKSLFPRKAWQGNYFTYTGSSIVPPCKEGRIRVVYQRPIRISAKQLHAFRGLYNERNQYIWNNYRPVQSSHYVQVFSSVDKMRPATTTTTTQKPANIVEEPYYHHQPTQKTTTLPPNIVEEVYPEYPPVTVKPTVRPNIVPTTTEELYY